MNILSIFKKKSLVVENEKGELIVLDEESGKKKIAKWKAILSTQDKAIDKIEVGIKLGKSWLDDFEPRVNTAKIEMEDLKKSIQSVSDESNLLILGKRYISKDRLIKNLLVAKHGMEGNLRIANLQFNRLQDRAVDLATRIQESEIYLAMSGSLEVARQYIQEIEEPITEDSRESLIQFKSLTSQMDNEDDINEEEVKKLFRKEFTRVARRNDTAVVRKNRTTTKGKSKASSARK